MGVDGFFGFRIWLAEVCGYVMDCADEVNDHALTNSTMSWGCFRSRSPLVTGTRINLLYNFLQRIN